MACLQMRVCLNKDIQVCSQININWLIQNLFKLWILKMIMRVPQSKSTNGFTEIPMEWLIQCMKNLWTQTWQFYFRPRFISKVHFQGFVHDRYGHQRPFCPSPCPPKIKHIFRILGISIQQWFRIWSSSLLEWIWRYYAMHRRRTIHATQWSISIHWTEFPWSKCSGPGIYRQYECVYAIKAARI